MSIRKLLIILLVMVCAVSVSAQVDVVPVNIGENVTGQISAATPVAAFSVNVSRPQTVEIQVLTIGTGLTPTFRVIDPSGLVLQGVDNSAGRTTVTGVVSFSTAGQYRIEVGGTFGTAGTFLLSLQEGDPLEAPEPLQAGEGITGRVDSSQTRQAFTVSSNPNGFQLLTVESRSSNASPVFALRNNDSSELLGSAGALLGGARFRLPPGSTVYLIEVLFSGQNADFFVCLEAENGTVRCPGSTVGGGGTVLQPTQQIVATSAPFATATFIAATQIPFPTINPAGACMAATNGGTPVNVRSGPSTTNGIVTQLSPLTTALVLGRLADATWYQVTVNGLTGWVSGTVVRIGGNCSTISVIAPPIGTPVTGATFTSTSLFTATPTATATATNPPTPVPTLNFNLPPNFGSTALTSGFIPDPFTMGLISGGTVDVSYLGAGCTGFAATAPDFSVNYTSGAFQALRFYFIGGGDTTMIINGPGANYFCNDDSFSTLNPTLDFNSPSSGRYDIWIGSFSSGTSISGTLSVTENLANHP